MPRLRDVLDRFRPAGAPGQASAVGVPADLGAGLAAELEPLFARLVPVEKACEDLLESARRDAATVGADAARQAGRTVALARRRLDAERAGAVATARLRLDAESADAMRSAEREVSRLRRASQDAMPAQLERIVDSVRALLGEDQPGGAAGSGS